MRQIWNSYAATYTVSFLMKWDYLIFFVFYCFMFFREQHVYLLNTYIPVEDAGRSIFIANVCECK